MAASRTDGFLLVDKPAGATSQDAVTAVRKSLHAERAGHTGTLDPFATGLLIVLVGQATRLARFVPAEPKTYEAEILFGHETDTDDSSGAPTSTAGLPEEHRVYEAMRQLTGSLQQSPPSYSAKHVGGERAYALARAGASVQLAPVTVSVHSWDVISHDDSRWRVRITCGSGTYIRALARDLGRATGSAAHLAALRRTRIAGFDVADAAHLTGIREGQALSPAIEALPGMATASLGDDDVLLVRHGRPIPAAGGDTRVALVNQTGDIVAIAERAGEYWQPRVVFDA